MKKFLQVNHSPAEADNLSDEKVSDIQVWMSFGKIKILRIDIFHF